MDPVTALTRLGGVAGTRSLLRLTSARRLRTAVAAGTVIRSHRGRYCLPETERDLRAAARVNGVLALRSAALFHGWPVKFPPQVPEIAVPRKRHVRPVKGIRLVWVDGLDTSMVATPPLPTVLGCARRLPFDEALAVADSALRSGSVTVRELREVGDTACGAGAAAIRRVARYAIRHSANPFESVLRAIAIEAGLDPKPQHPIDIGERVIHPDLVAGRLVLEADSWEWYTGKQAHVRDCERYNALILHGYLVLRFSWERVMLDPAYVRACLEHVERPQPQAEPRARTGSAADQPLLPVVAVAWV